MHSRCIRVKEDVPGWAEVAMGGLRRNFVEGHSAELRLAVWGEAPCIYSKCRIMAECYSTAAPQQDRAPP